MGRSSLVPKLNWRSHISFHVEQVDLRSNFATAAAAAAASCRLIILELELS
jgi:hypothetical protein